MGFVVNYPPVTKVTVDETTNEVVVAAAGPRGPQGDPGVVAATAPITYDSGTQTVALDESGIEIAPSQVTGTAVVDNDSRLSDARTPTAHAASHESGGGDEINLGSLSGTLALSQVSDAQAQAHGFPATMAALIGAPTSGNLVLANYGWYYRIIGIGTITAIGIHVEVSSGNIDVGLYRPDTQFGRNNALTRVVSTGSIACPAAGFASISLGGSYTVEPGDYFAIAADNTTATFRRAAGQGISALYSGIAGIALGFPLSASASYNNAHDRAIAIVGIS